MSDEQRAGVAEQDESADPFRSGFVALCGRPNVGKSTLLNALIGEELALATARPQTTRERMLGVWTNDDFQAVLVDTPGMHRAKSALNRYMVDEATRGARDVDLVMMLAEVPRLGPDQLAEWEPGPGAKQALEKLVELGHRIVLVLTKCDLLEGRDALLPVIAAWGRLHEFHAVLPVSALRKQGLDAVRELVAESLPEGPPLYPTDVLSDRPLRWHAAELIRGQLFEALGEEVPYSCAVSIERFEESDRGDRIEASIHVERESQKGIVIGKRGARIKAVGAAARKQISQLTGRPCALYLQVRVRAGWTDDPNAMGDFGYHGEG